MDLNAIVALAHQYLPAELWQKGLAVVGAFSLVSQALPKFLAWAIPASTRAADWVANLLLSSPRRPLIIWKAAAIIAFLDALSKALDDVIDTFRTELEADIQKAASAQVAPPQAATPEVPAVTPQIPPNK